MLKTLKMKIERKKKEKKVANVLCSHTRVVLFYVNPRKSVASSHYLWQRRWLHDHDNILRGHLWKGRRQEGKNKGGQEEGKVDKSCPQSHCVHVPHG